MSHKGLLVSTHKKKNVQDLVRCNQLEVWPPGVQRVECNPTFISISNASISIDRYERDKDTIYKSDWKQNSIKDESF